MNNSYLNQPMQYQQMPGMRQAQSVNGITWVQGIESAKAFSLPPNSNAQLMDSENEGIFYIKTSDDIGMCNLRTFKYEEITGQIQSTQSPDLSQYVRKDELQDLLKSVLEGGRNEQSISTAKQNKQSQSKPVITE